MQPSRLIRIAFVFAALLAIGHTLGAPWIPASPDEAASISQSMKTTHFAVMGTDRTLWEFYIGFGALISLYLATNAVLLWQLGTVAKTHVASARPLVLTLAVSAVLGTILSIRFFFAAPIVLSAGTAIFAILAYAKARRETQNVSRALER